MPQRIKKNVSFDATSGAIQESLLDIAVPEGQVIQVIGVAVNLGLSNDGTTFPREIYAAVNAKLSNLTSMDSADLDTAPEPIALGSLMEKIAAGGSVSASGKNYIDIGPNPYALAPYVAIGCEALGAGHPTFECLFVIDYEIVKLTSAIATTLAVR